MVMFSMDPDEDDVDFPTPTPPAAPGPPPRAELRIVDASVKKRGKACVVCGRAKPPHIEVGIDGVVEYTCRDCYELQSQGISPEITAYCVTCGTALLKGDHFCGKCGNPAALSCPKCGARPEEEDAFCGKCGASLRASA